MLTIIQSVLIDPLQRGISLALEMSCAKDIAMSEPDLDPACDMALQNQYPNPRPLERAAMRQLLQNALDGTRPN